jgi:hypothetical protein
MLIVRDIFNLKYGHWRPVKALLDEAKAGGFFASIKSPRLLTDFTGDAYRVILEGGYDSLADYEKRMSEETGQDQWREWYMKFTEHVISGHREILRLIE